MIQWWRDLNRYSPVLWIPIALVGHLGGRVALCFLVIVFLKGPLHLTLGRVELIVCGIVAWFVSWVPLYIAELSKVDPIKATHGDVWVGWGCVVVAGAVYSATALMGR